MKGMILAAGVGERMLPLTKDIPKPMLPLNGRPMIDYQTNLMRSHGISDIAITTYYLGNKIIDHFGDGRDIGLNISYLVEPVLIPSARAIKQLESFVDSDVFVINGDNFTNLNVERLRKFHEGRGADISMVTYLKNPEDGPDSFVDFEPDGRVREFVEKLTEGRMNQIPPERRYTNCGIYILSKRFVKSISPSTDNNLGPEIVRALDEGFGVYAYTLKGNEFFCELGEMGRYKDTKEKLEAGKLTIDI